jgi:lysophospholipase L1-like esterase
MSLSAAPPGQPGLPTGTIADGENITIPGSNNGSGPTVHFFDDFESGTVGQPIKTGPGSAKIGEWKTFTLGSGYTDTTYYSNTHQVSGTKSFQSRYDLYTWNTNKYNRSMSIPSATQIYVSWYQLLPSEDNWPGEHSVSEANWKSPWLLSATGTSDYTPVVGSDSGTFSIFGNAHDRIPEPDAYEYFNFKRKKGVWQRESMWVKGSTTISSLDGAFKYWMADGTTPITLHKDKVNINTMENGDTWGLLNFSYGRIGQQDGKMSRPSYDDIYVAVGPNAQARVEVGNASIYTNCTKFATFTPITWGASSITAQVNNGPFKAGDSAWLFVINSLGEASPGRPITFGASAPDTVPPTFDTTNPVNGAVGVTVNSTVTANASENLLCSTTSGVTITPGNKTISCLNNTITLTTSGQEANTVYTVTIPTTVTDLAGNNLATAKVWSYTTVNSAETCETDSSLCQSAEECTTAWPTNSWCPLQTPSCTASPCDIECSFENWQLCSTQSACETAGRYWWPETDGACRTVEQPANMIGNNLLTNPNLTAWTNNRPDLWSSYYWSGVLPVALGANLFNGGNLQKQNIIQENKKYVAFYNHLEGDGTSKSYLLDTHVLNVGPGTYVRTFDAPPEPITDHSVSFYQHSGAAVTLNNFGLYEVSTESCSTTWVLCQTPSTCEDAGWFYYNGECNELTASVMLDNFTDGNATGWTPVNNAQYGTPAWTVVDGEYYQSSTGLRSFDQSYYKGAYSYWPAGSSWTDYKVHAQITPVELTTSGDNVGIHFRHIDNDNYYRFSYSRIQGFYRLEKMFLGEFSTLSVATGGPLLNEVQDVTIEANGSNLTVKINGIPILAAIDTDLTTGTIALYAVGTDKFDNIAVEAVDSLPNITISAPVKYHVIAGDGLTFSAVVNNLPTDGYVTFTIDGVEGGQILSAPFEEEISSLADGDHTISATIYTVDGGIESTDRRNFATGGISIVSLGDEITTGIGDDVTTDYVASNSRNTGRGYTPVLSGWLENNLNIPTIIYNNGMASTKAIDSLYAIDSVMARHPESLYYLILYGTNDATATTPTPPGNTCSEADLANEVVGCNATFKSYIRTSILALKAAGKIPLLALVPYNKGATATQNTAINNYNSAIGQLIVEHNLAIEPPNLYTYFQTNQNQLVDMVHPDGTGYQAVANLWYKELTDYWTGIFEPGRASVIHATIH